MTQPATRADNNEKRADAIAQRRLLPLGRARQKDGGAEQRWQQCAVRLKYGRRGVEHSHEQGSGGRRGALTPGEGAKTVDRVSWRGMCQSEAPRDVVSRKEG